MGAQIAQMVELSCHLFFFYHCRDPFHNVVIQSVAKIALLVDELDICLRVTVHCSLVQGCRLQHSSLIQDQFQRLLCTSVNFCVSHLLLFKCLMIML